MALGNFIKAGAALGVAALSSEKVQSAVSGALEKSTERMERAAAAMATGDGAGAKSKGLTTGLLSSKAAPRNINAKCLGCHAPLSGVTDTRYRCPYCDTVQTLEG